MKEVLEYVLVAAALYVCIEKLYEYMDMKRAIMWFLLIGLGFVIFALKFWKLCEVIASRIY